MCGLNGTFSYHPGAPLPDAQALLVTRDHMATRGPDGAGVWWREDRRLGLGHRRLSIIDLSERAAQPMASSDGRLQIVYNGEIYNFPELRAGLEAEGLRFKTNSDTEVLLHLYAREGRDFVKRLRGMFAFAIWDAAARGLLLARDPFGIKPLYLADDGRTLRFASQVKALIAGGGVDTAPEPAGIVGFHIWGSVPEPFTIYRGIRVLPAGHSIWVPEGGPAERPCSFVSLPSVISEGLAARTLAAGNTMDIGNQVRKAVLNSVQAHLLADVDVGLFLSAGINSGTLLGLMKDSGVERVHAITLGFDSFAGTHDDEVPLATTVAQYFGARHEVHRVGQADFESAIPAILEAMDQPSIDGVNTWFVAKAAREAGLKVALSGLGGDELFAGYSGFRRVPRLARALRPFGTVATLGIAVRRAMRLLNLARRQPKLSGLMEYGDTLEGAYLLWRGLFMPFELDEMFEPDLVSEGLGRLNLMDRLRGCLEPDPGSDLGRISALEYQNYTRNQLLRDADWAGMAHSVEIRTPLIDIALLRDLAPMIPDFSGGKQALAAASSRPLPSVIVNRSKSGFSVPMGRWMAEAADARSSGAGRRTETSKGLASRAWAQALFEAQCGTYDRTNATASCLAAP